MSSLTIKDFKRGMNNLAPDSELAVMTNRGQEGWYLRDAVNVDTMGGQMKRRRGTVKVLAGSDCHSLWSDGTQQLFVDGTQLKQMFGAVTSLTSLTLMSGLAPGRRVSYAKVNDSVYFSNGVMIARLRGGVVGTAADERAMLDLQLAAGPYSLGLRPLPPGDILAFLNGRLYSASGAFLYYSEPYMFGTYNPGRNYIQFPAPITMVEPCQNGVFVSADQTYWIAGDPSVAELNPVLPYKAIPGTSGQVPNSNSCFWLSERGIVMGSQTGEVKNLQEDKVATGSADAGASLFREVDGVKQIIAPVFGPQDTVMAARSFFDAEVIRKETAL